MFSYTVCPSFAPLCLSVGVTLETRQGSRGGWLVRQGSQAASPTSGPSLLPSTAPSLAFLSSRSASGTPNYWSSPTVYTLFLAFHVWDTLHVVMELYFGLEYFPTVYGSKACPPNGYFRSWISVLLKETVRPWYLPLIFSLSLWIPGEKLCSAKPGPTDHGLYLRNWEWDFM